MVRVEGLEPPCLAAPDPKSGMSTNFTTPAVRNLMVDVMVLQHNMHAAKQGIFGNYK